MHERKNMKKRSAYKIVLLVSLLLLLIKTVSCNKEEKEKRAENERLMNYEKDIIKTWGESPVTILNRELPRDGKKLPCPSGWDSDCKYLWEANAEYHAYKLFDDEAYEQHRKVGYWKVGTKNELWPSELISDVNRRISRPLPCNATGGHSIESWPRQKIWDPVATFSNYMRRYGSTNGGMAIIAIDPNVIEAALQIAIMQQNISENELENLRKAAIAQLFKPRAKSFIIMHNSPNTIYFGNWEPKLVSMKHGEGNLVGMSVSMGRGLYRTKAGLMIFEDRVCSDDVSFSVAAPLANGYTYDFIFEGEGNLLTLLAAAFQPHIPEQPVLDFSAQQDTTNYQKDSRAQVSSGMAAVKDLWSVVQFALEIVKFIRGI